MRKIDISRDIQATVTADNLVRLEYSDGYGIIDEFAVSEKDDAEFVVLGLNLIFDAFRARAAQQYTHGANLRMKELQTEIERLQQTIRGLTDKATGQSEPLAQAEAEQDES